MGLVLGRMILVYMMLCVTVALAAGSGVSWGGKGFDSIFKGKDSARFKANFNEEDSSLLVQVDSKETAYELVRSMRLNADNNISIFSDFCHKAMRHEDAPSLCSFSVEKIRGLTGKGMIQVYNHSDHLVLEWEIDLDLIKAAIEQ